MSALPRTFTLRKRIDDMVYLVRIDHRKYTAKRTVPSWAQLLEEARQQGLTPEDVRNIFAIIKENNKIGGFIHE